MTVVAVSMLLAWATYRFVERPIRFSPSLARRSGPVFVLLILASMLGLAGIYVYVDKGITSRFPLALQPLLPTDADHEWMFRNSRCLIGGEEVVFPSQCVESANLG